MVAPTNVYLVAFMFILILLLMVMCLSKVVRTTLSQSPYTRGHAAFEFHFHMCVAYSNLHLTRKNESCIIIHNWINFSQIDEVYMYTSKLFKMLFI